MTTSTITGFKRGDTFSLAGTYKVNGAAASVSGMTIASHVRTQAGTLVQNLTVAQTAFIGGFSLTATATQTAAWPATTLVCDIQFTQNGIVQSTETFSIAVEDDVTK